MKHIKKISTYATAGGFGALVMSALSGCGDGNMTTQNQTQNSATMSEVATKQGAFVIIEETEKGKYKVVEEYPASETRVVLKSLDGTERVLTKDEMDKLVAEENAKIDAGTSNLTNANSAQLSSATGMGLGEVLLSSIAGAVIGSWIGNKLFNNQNFQSQRQSAYKNPSTYSRSVDSFNKAKTSANTPKGSAGKSGFFGSKSGTASSSKTQQSVGG